MNGRQKDELIIAKILSVPHTLGRSIASGNGFNISPESPYPSCAVGAGVLYAGLGCEDYSDALQLFAKAHNVTRTYAAGVSDGFETNLEGRILCVRYSAFNDVIETSEDYKRGFAVGAAVRAAI